MRKKLTPDFNRIFNSAELSTDELATLKDTLTSMGFHRDGLTTQKMSAGGESWTKYEIFLPYKTYTLSTLMNIHRAIESSLKRHAEFTLQSKKVGTLICLEFR